MPPLSKLTPRQLRIRLEQVNQEIEACCPALVAERRLLEQLVTAADDGPQATYAGIRRPIEAIELCLDLNGPLMTRQEIYDSLMGGGFPMNPQTAWGTLNDLLNYHSGKTNGRLMREGDQYCRRPSKKIIGTKP